MANFVKYIASICLFCTFGTFRIVFDSTNKLKYKYNS